MRNIKIISVLALILSGCGGGGGGGSSSNNSDGVVPTVAFTSWGAVRPNTRVVAPGISSEATYTENSSGGVSSVGDYTNYYGVEFTETLDSNGQISKATITTGDGDRLVFDKSDGATFTPLVGGAATVAINKDFTELAIATDPATQGWNYQTFGVWQRYPSSTDTGRIGAISTGAFTDANRIPTTSSAIFTGSAAGVYQFSSLTSYLASADMALNVNFANRTASFATSNTYISNDGGASSSPYSSIDLSGSMTLIPNQNNMYGAVTSRNGMTGIMHARFYGPNAEEVGGTFGVSGSGVQTFVGGFGGTR